MFWLFDATEGDHADYGPQKLDVPQTFSHQGYYYTSMNVVTNGWSFGSQTCSTESVDLIYEE